MNLKIDNIREILDRDNEVWISNKAFEDDVKSMMSYYVRNAETESGPLLERAKDGDLYDFGLEYLQRLLYPEVNQSIAIEEVTEDKLKIVKL